MTTTIKAEDVMKLRESTGAGVMACKEALMKSGGDAKKALAVLKEKGLKTAALKSLRKAKAGTIHSYIHHDSRIGVLVEVNCETDFVAKNEEFQTLAYNIAMQIAATNPQYLKMSDIPEMTKKEAEEVFAEEVEGKPADMKAKILEGKINAYFKDKVLLEQAYIKNPEVTINNLLESFIQKFGERTEIGRFSRIGVGQK